MKYLPYFLSLSLFIIYPVNSQILIESIDNEFQYKISSSSKEIIGEIFDPILNSYKKVPLKGFSYDILKGKYTIIPFTNCIECRQLQLDSGKIAQFNVSREYEENEIIDLDNLQIDHIKDHIIEISAGGICFEKKHTLFFPSSKEDIINVIQLAKKHQRKIRVIGTTHSLNPLCHTNDYLISLKNMNKIIDVSEDSCTFEGGVIIRDLCKELDRHGLTLPVLGSICEQMFVGAISTGTRGQVPNCGSLASIVTEIELIDGMGQLKKINLEHNPEELSAAATSMGLMGIITKVKIKCIPLFLMSEMIRRVNLENVFLQLDELNQNEKLVMFWNVAGDEVKVLTGHRVACHLPTNELAHFETLGQYPHLHSMENFPDTLQRIGKSWEIISFVKWSDEKTARHSKKMKEEGKGVLQGDYSIPKEQLISLIKELKIFFQDNKERLNLTYDRMVIEIRPVKADHVWLSPSYKRDSYSLCFHDFQRDLSWPTLGKEDLSFLESLLKKYDVRPHLGKAHFFNNKDLSKAFPKWKTFKELRAIYDPENIFLTDYLFQLLSDQDRIF